MKIIPNPKPKIYTDQQYTNMVQKYASLIGTRINDSFIDLAEDAGADWATFDRWEREDKDVREILTTARRKRAWNLIGHSVTIIKSIDLVDSANNDKLKRNAMAYLLQARVLSDLYKTIAGYLAPDTFGNLAHEIKQMQKEIKDLQKMIVSDKSIRKHVKIDDPDDLDNADNYQYHQ